MKTETLSDLDELVLKCRTAHAKEYIAEALSCYKAGAYRAAIVSCWIAIVFDLIDKFRELSIAGDGQARNLIDKFERYQSQIDAGNDNGIKSALEFERDILKTAKEDLQLFDHQQFEDLGRLRADRHRCAHPSFQRMEEPYKPSPEQVRMHLRNAIIYVLSQAPVQGRAGIKQVVALVSSEYFPKDVEQAKTQLESSAFIAARPPLVRGVIDALMFGFFEDGNPLKFNSRPIAALKASLLLHRALVEERIGEQIQKIFRNVPDGTIMAAVLLVLEIPEAWAALDQAGRDKVNLFIESGPAKEILPTLKKALNVPELEEKAKERILTLNGAELSEGILKWELGEFAVNRAVQLYTTVRSWTAANSLTDDVILPLMKYFGSDDIERIIRSPRDDNADLPNSTGFAKFIKALKDQDYITIDQINELLQTYDLTQYLIEDEDMTPSVTE